MFSIFRKAKGVEAAALLLKQTLAPLTVLGRTVPGSIFSDPYVLGYLTAIASFAGKVAVNGKLSTDELGEVLTRAFHEVAGINGRAAVENTIRFSSEGNQNFLTGAEKANKLIDILYGRPNMNDSEVAAAFQMAPEITASYSFIEKVDKNSLTANAAAAFSFFHFNQYIQKNHNAKDTL